MSKPLSSAHVSASPAPSFYKTWRAAGIWLGLGIGGFFDGIVLHQILQWHHLVSEVYPPTTLQNLKFNTLADGLFHAATWVFTLIGLVLLWRGTRGTHQPRPTLAFVGALLFGWGLFNVLEGTVSHQLLGLHHVRPGPDQLAYDLGFLVWGAAMLVTGGLLMRGEKRSGTL
ncbi:DUF2243 domain-containing protein [Deinococcus sp. QL22]|uniref:DUF2243 domain-containing protein n=1 Tax=Deinococcus sp. QL22 TaxID=2939437 RepID=UPI0020173457|nr:DUF2243 domain-containing protein [Deinococcus sp. QL22]UQN09987.1 DUF2243 domain-containing protein [Deinococcus sp. QL22]